LKEISSKVASICREVSRQNHQKSGKMITESGEMTFESFAGEKKE
jgi:hypothetical protein